MDTFSVGLGKETDFLHAKHHWLLGLKNLLLIAIFQTVGCRPIASLDHFLPEHLGTAQLVEEVPTGTSKVVKVKQGR